jgi:hypothetical protein
MTGPFLFPSPRLLFLENLLRSEQPDDENLEVTSI